MKQLARLARRATRRLPAVAPLICAALCLALTAACSQPPARPPAPLPTYSPPSHTLASSHPTPAQPAQPAQPATPLPALPSQPAPLPATATPTPFPPSTDPPANVAFTQISAGKSHACGLIENGAIICWGHDYFGHDNLDAPAGTGYRQIAAGRDFACALRQDQTIACWGDNSERQTSPPQGAFAEIAAGTAHACAIPASQSQTAPPALVCWGKSFPNGATTLPLDAPISDIQANAQLTCGLTPQADLACVSLESRLAEITPGPFTGFGVGLHHVCALHQDGAAYCQGLNDSLQASPPPTKFAQIAGGWYHTCGITLAGDIECWGSHRPASPGERLTAPDGEFTAISIGWRNSCALNPDRRALCWRTPDHIAYQLPIGISEAFGGAKFQSPVEIFPWPTGGLAITDRSGIIAVHHDQPNAPPPKTILDISDSVLCCPGEIGLYTAALDPQFADFPYLYAWYGAVADNALGEETPGVIGRLSRYRVNNGVALKDSALTILEVIQPGIARLGSALRFGPDGMLYLSLGVGDGSASANAQSLAELRGKIIRIDIRGATPAHPYRIPPDNPFARAPDARPEIWAYGLRSPWRMDFDPTNPNRIFVADVGESTKEEVSIATPGANLGWPLCEADICQETLTPALAATLTPPVVAYGRDQGCAVIGGLAVPWLDNQFIFGDFCSRRLWLLEPNNLPDDAPGNAQDALPDSAHPWRIRQIADLSTPVRFLYSFGLATDGSVYVLARESPILRLHPALVK